MSKRPAIAQSCAKDFQLRFGRLPDVVSWAPGRINLIGGHTDYNEGLALPAAIDRWVSVAIAPRADDQINIRSLNFESELRGVVDSIPAPVHSWEKFFVGCVDLFGLAHPLPSGFDAVFVGDVPDGAGLSSSAALTVAWMTALRAWTGADISDVALAKMCQSVEHRYLDVQCGLLDQMASLMSRPGQVMRIDFRDLSVQYVPVGCADVEWVVLHTGVRRELAKSGYWLRVEECTSGLAAIQQTRPEVGHFRDLKQEWLTGEDTFNRRLRHVVSENARVEVAAQCIAQGAAEDMGRLLFEAHASLRDDYQVSCDQLDCLVDLASEDLVCMGARMVGGGFGGCTLNMVQAGQGRAFSQRILRAYRQRFSEDPRAYCFELVGGAGVN